MSDVLYPLFSVFTFLGFVLVLIPLPWHFRTWNSGTCFLMMWSALACLNQFVNSVVWANDAINRAPGWCDISIRVTLAASVGIPAASLCINRRLYQITRAKTETMSAAENRRSSLIDTLVCVLFPLIYVALQYIVQSHRFDIYEQVGCFPALSNTIPVYFLTMIWPPLISVVSAVYSLRSLYTFRASRAAFPQFLQSASGTTLSELTVSRYLRLVVLAATAVLIITPFSTLALWVTVTSTPVARWHSLAATHLNFSRVNAIPVSVWRGSKLLDVALELARWSAPMSAMAFFALFGFAPEARQQYTRFVAVTAAALWRVLALLSFKRPASGIFAAPFVQPALASGSAASASSLTLGRRFGPGIEYTKPAPSFEKDVKSTLSRFSAASRVPTSRFSDYDDDASFAFSVSVSSAYSADSHVDAHTPPMPTPPSATSTYFVPPSATSFGTASSASTFAYALPLHIGWHEEAYPASPTSYAHQVRDPDASDDDDARTDGSWSPVSDAHSVNMDALPQQQDTAARGRALT